MKYRKKPVVIEAHQWPGGVCAYDVNHWAQETGFPNFPLTFRDGNYGLVIHTLEGDHIARPNDYIIKGVQGEYYPCKPDIFEATYEPVED